MDLLTFWFPRKKISYAHKCSGLPQFQSQFYPQPRTLDVKSRPAPFVLPLIPSPPPLPPSGSPLAVAAVAVLASTARERATGKQEGDGRDEGNPGEKAEAERGGGGGGAEGGRLTAARDVDALTVERIQDVRLLSAAIPRLLHLHEDPRPFSGLCLSMFTAADVSAEADGSAGGCKAEDKGEEGEQSKFAGSEDRRTAAMKACQGMVPTSSFIDTEKSSGYDLVGKDERGMKTV